MRSEQVQIKELLVAGILLFTIVVGSLIAITRRFNEKSAALSARISKLENATVEISPDEWKVINSNFEFISGIADEAKAMASNAHERIEYYRDVLKVVSRTAPSPKRIRLPILPGGDPKVTK